MRKAPPRKRRNRPTTRSVFPATGAARGKRRKFRKNLLLANTNSIKLFANFIHQGLVSLEIPSEDVEVAIAFASYPTNNRDLS